MSTHAYTRRAHARDKSAMSKPREINPAFRLGLQHRAPSAIIQRAALSPESIRPAEIMRLQQTLGNRAVGTLLNRPVSSRPVIQAKLTVNAPGDEYEQEADRVADAVMRIPAVQRVELEDEDEEPEVMTKREPGHAAGGAFEAGEEFEQQLRASQGQGEALPTDLRAEFEAKFNTDFSAVRIHTDSQSAELNRAIQARAFTHGRDIYLGAGQYASESGSGKRLLAHELTHVVQQQGTAPPCIQTRRTNVTGQEWSEYLTKDGKKETVEKNYQESKRRGEQIKQSYKAWLGNKRDKKGQTKALRAKGYRASVKDTGPGSFRMKTARWIERFATVKEKEMIEATKDRPKLEKLLADNNFDVREPLTVIEKKFQGERQTMNASYDFVLTKEEMSAWEISGQDKVGNKKTLVAKPDGFGDVTVMEFSGEANDKVKEQYKNSYDLSEKRFTAEENYKDQEPEQLFAASNSEILWMHYKAALAKAQGNVGKIVKKGNLTEVVRQTVVNKQTLDTIFLCDDGGTVNVIPPEATVTSDKDDFWALLGTPNGTAPGYLLIDHGAALGFEGFDSIHYLKNQLTIKYRGK
jgi:hypothetical protein